MDQRCERDSERDLKSSFLEKFPKPRQTPLLPTVAFFGLITCGRSQVSGAKLLLMTRGKLLD